MAEQKMKVCLYCGEEKPITEFSPTAKSKAHSNKDGTGRINRCTTCIGSQRMQRQSRDVEVFLRDLFTKNKSGRKNKFEWSIKPEDLLELWELQGGKCALSGVYMTHHVDRGHRKDFNISIDRIRSTEGYMRGNIQLVCQRVNTIKNDLDEASLYWWIKNLYDFSCD